MLKKLCTVHHFSLGVILFSGRICWPVPWMCVDFLLLLLLLVLFLHNWVWPLQARRATESIWSRTPFLHWRIKGMKCEWKYFPRQTGWRSWKILICLSVHFYLQIFHKYLTQRIWHFRVGADLTFCTSEIGSCLSGFVVWLKWMSKATCTINGDDKCMLKCWLTNDWPKLRVEKWAMSSHSTDWKFLVRVAWQPSFLSPLWLPWTPQHLFPKGKFEIILAFSKWMCIKTFVDMHKLESNPK